MRPLLYIIFYNDRLAICNFSKFCLFRGGKLVDISAEKQKEYDETLSNLKKAYAADKDDYSKFPAFTFHGK